MSTNKLYELKRPPLHDEKKKKICLNIVEEENKKIYPNINEVKDETSDKSENLEDIYESDNKEVEVSPSGKECMQYFNIYNTYKWPIFIIILSVFFIGFAYIFQTYFTSNEINVTNIMKNMKDTFPDQPNLTFRIIESAIKRATSDEDSSPGILMLLTSKEGQENTKQFATHLVKSISKDSKFISIEHDLYNNAQSLKKYIDVTIQENLNQSGQTTVKGVLVERMDQIPFEAALIFHSYCDHENAPFRKALYVMTIYSDEKLSSNCPSKQLDILASTLLKAAWRNSGEDQVSSLITRLTGSVALVAHS